MPGAGFLYAASNTRKNYRVRGNLCPFFLTGALRSISIMLDIYLRFQDVRLRCVEKTRTNN